MKIDISDKVEQINQLTRTNEQIQKDHAVELERVIEKAELDKEKALYEVKNEYRDKIIEINEGITLKSKGFTTISKTLEKSMNQRLNTFKNN